MIDFFDRSKLRCLAEEKGERERFFFEILEIDFAYFSRRFFLDVEHFFIVIYII